MEKYKAKGRKEKKQKIVDSESLFIAMIIIINLSPSIGQDQVETKSSIKRNN